MRAPPSSDPNDPGSLGPVLDFMRRLWAVDHALHSLSKRMETRMGLTSPQRLVVRIVGRFPGINAGQLAGILHVHPSTLTGVLARLEDRGLVSRRADPGDLRRALFTLTARGRGLDQPRHGTVEAALESTLAALPERNIRIAEQVLAQIADALSLDLPLPSNGKAARGPRAPGAKASASAARASGSKPPASSTRASGARATVRGARAMVSKPSAGAPDASGSKPSSNGSRARVAQASAGTLRVSAAKASTSASRTSASKAPATQKRAPVTIAAPARGPRGRVTTSRVPPTTRAARDAARKGS